MTSLPAEFVSIHALRKSFGQIEVLKGVELAFNRGEIHAFIGANGAGKSTLLGCLAGAELPTSGTIVIEGKSFRSLTPRLAFELGIGIIYQHFQVFDGLNVSDNIFLGKEIRRFGVVDVTEQLKRSAALLRRLGVSLDPRTPLERLSIGERQVVEIARALHSEPRLLILDEPTAALSEPEILALHNVVRNLAHQEGLAVVYVTHLIEEIGAIADKVTILRDGAVVWTREAGAVNPRIVAEAIAPSAKGTLCATMGQGGGSSALRMEAFCAPFTGPIELDIRAGEIVGLYGLMGSGRTDLLECLIGARPQRGGQLFLNDKAVHIASPRVARNRGMALVASDRKEQSMFGTLSAMENLLIPHLEGHARQRRTHIPMFRQTADRLKLSPNSPHLLASRFSGGNAQKLVMGRWLLPGLNIKVLLLDEPTQGVDVGARSEIYRLLRIFVDQGGAVLLASSDPSEIIAVANRVLVLGDGQPLALLESETTEHELVRLAHSGFSLAGSERAQSLEAPAQ
jgi:ribose transport system ATP-binding protein